jgi:hypothetical protein
MQRTTENGNTIAALARLVHHGKEKNEYRRERKHTLKRVIEKPSNTQKFTKKRNCVSNVAKQRRNQ